MTRKSFAIFQIFALVCISVAPLSVLFIAPQKSEAAATISFVGPYTALEAPFDGPPPDISFSGMSLGTAAQDRIIFVMTTVQENGGSCPTASAIIIAGITGTELGVSASDPDANNCLVQQLFWANVPTGTSGTIEVQLTNDAHVGIALFRATGIGTSPTASDSASNADDVISMSIDVPDQGILIAGSAFESNGAITTVGVTEDYEDLTGVPVTQQFVAGGSAGPLSQETNRTVSFDGTNLADAVGIAASFAPENTTPPRVIRLRGKVHIRGGTHFR